MDSFDKNALAEYFIRLRRVKPNLANLPDEKILQLQGITDHGKPTVAGIMMLGEYPQAYFPQLSVTAVSYTHLLPARLRESARPARRGLRVRRARQAHRVL